jgi:ankyrin repeat protein
MDGDTRTLASRWENRNPEVCYLSIALKYEKFKAAAWIVKADPSSLNRLTPTHESTTLSEFLYSWTPLMRCRSNEAVEFLLAHRANVFIRNQYGFTALHYLCGCTSVNILPLLARGADERQRDDCGASALDYARTYSHPQLPVLENYRKLMGLVQARQQCKITLSTDFMRSLQPFLYSI